MLKDFRKLTSITLFLLILFLTTTSSFALENNTHCNPDLITPVTSDANSYPDIDINEKSELNDEDTNNINPTNNEIISEKTNNNPEPTITEDKTTNLTNTPNSIIKNTNTSLGNIDTTYTNNINFNNGKSNTISLYSIETQNIVSTGLNTFPSKYDLRDYGYVTSVKNQGDRDTCWAFTALSVLESCILKSTGINYDFSENNLINVIKGYSKYGLKDTSESGNIMNALGYLLSWLGPVNESDDKYQRGHTTSPILNSLIHIQNVLFIEISNRMDLNPIKEAIIKYGAVGTSIYWNTDYDYIIGENYYNYYDTIPNHAITIVGWDDNYSKDNFYNTPAGNGAWIVKNSWGTKNGDNGYFYVSYYDKSINYNGDSNKIYTFILDDTASYDKNYQYDYAGATATSMEYVNNIWIKNVFKANRNEYLTAVSTYFLQEVKWEVYIYVNNQLKHKQSSTSKPGYYTIKLTKKISLKVNDKFSVVYHLKTVDGSNLKIPVCSAKYTLKDYTSPHKSYKSLDGTNWYDTYDYQYSNCIKAFTITNNVIEYYGEIIFSGNKDMTVYYGSNKYYKVKVLDRDGNILKGTKVKIKIGKITKIIKTDSKGYAKIKIIQKPGKYKIKITCDYSSLINKLTVKSTIITKNTIVKKWKPIKFKAKLKNTKGRIIKGKKLSFNFKGKTYKVKTNKKGIATLIINKKLKKGRYEIKTSYNKFTVSNKITIK